MTYILSENDYESFSDSMLLYAMAGHYELHEWQWQLLGDLFRGDAPRSGADAFAE